MVSTADDMNASYRSNFEDAHSIVDEFGDEHTTFIGIYDGHGGAGTCMQAARAARLKALQAQRPDSLIRTARYAALPFSLTTGVHCYMTQALLIFFESAFMSTFGPSWTAKAPGLWKSA